MWQILKFLPRKLLSRITGLIVHWRGPRPFVTALILDFAAFYTIRVADAELPVEKYASLGDFFVRRLKPGLRPVAPALVVHPADSRIFQSGAIGDGGQCILAKGKKYSVGDLLVDPEWRQKYAGGYFISYYLCPTDYHRVHSPVEGWINKVTYVPGDLWPVHAEAVASIDSLYCVNERVAVELATEHGAVSVVFVGATNVGSIVLDCEPNLQTNRGKPAMSKVFETPVEVAKGQELGMFRMGSTVVCIFSEEYTKRFAEGLNLGPVVKVNSALTQDLPDTNTP